MAERVKINERLPQDILRLDEGIDGAWFRLRPEHWREDLAEALALALVAEPEDRLVFLVSDDQWQLRLQLAFETACVEGEIEVRA